MKSHSKYLDPYSFLAHILDNHFINWLEMEESLNCFSSPRRSQSIFNLKQIKKRGTSVQHSSCPAVWLTPHQQTERRTGCNMSSGLLLFAVSDLFCKELVNYSDCRALQQRRVSPYRIAAYMSHLLFDMNESHLNHLCCAWARRLIHLCVCVCLQWSAMWASCWDWTLSSCRRFWPNAPWSSEERRSARRSQWSR